MKFLSILVVLVPILQTFFLILPTLANDEDSFRGSRIRGGVQHSRDSTNHSRNLSIQPRLEKEEDSLLRLETPKKEKRIVGGGDASRNDYPAFVWWDGCGGTLISETVVLTAAHCIAKRTDEREDRILLVGAYSPDNDDNAAIERKYKAIVDHPKYNRIQKEDIGYDIALVVLEEPIYNTQVEPVVLNRDNTVPNSRSNNNNNFDLFVIGLGYTDVDKDGDGTDAATTLQELSVPYVPFPMCAAKYSQFENLHMNEEAMICAGGEQGEDSCSGDSGGPLFRRTATGGGTNNYEQVGLVSFGVDCGTKGYPSVYSRISDAIPWIDEFICLNAVRGTQTKTNCDNTFGMHYLLTIDVFVDNRPEDTSFKLYKVVSGDSKDDENEIELLYVPPTVIEDDVESSQSDIFSMDVNLLSGNYVLEVWDEKRNGMDGYSIMSEERIVSRNGDFHGESEKLSFAITETGKLRTPEDPILETPAPTITPTQPPLTMHSVNTKTLYEINIEIKYDSNPNEIQWLLMNKDTMETIYVVHYGDITSPGLQTIPLNIPEGYYWFVILDSERNGLQDDGYIQINKVFRTGEETTSEFLAYHTGEFDWKAEINFSLP